jgi:RecA-family ATPase
MNSNSSFSGGPDKGCCALFDTSDSLQARDLETLEFLKAILPVEGVHYLVLFKEGQDLPAHKVYTDLESMAYAIDSMARSTQLSIYHACATYKKAVIEIKDGDKAKRKYRIHENWDKAKAFWVDVDCGQDKFAKGLGYLTQTDACAAIDKFADTIGWPNPMIVDSGNGIHAYWPLIANIAHSKWVSIAKDLKATLHHCGVKADPSRTADFASILRPAGSNNRKNGAAKPVTVKRAGTPIQPDELASALHSYMAEHGVVQFQKATVQSSDHGINDDLIAHLKRVEGLEFIADVRSALRYLDPGMPRDQWRTLIWAIRHGLGDIPEALELADQWSCGALHSDSVTPNNYSSRADVEQVWNSYNPSHSDRVTVGSLYKMASDNGWSNLHKTANGAHQNRAQGSSGAQTKSEWSGAFKLTDGDVQISETPPAKRSYVFADTVTAGTYNVLAGSGGTLKTMLMMISAASMAVGQDLGDVRISQGAAMLFLGEEDHAEISRRLSATCNHYGFDPAVVSRLVKAFPAAGVDLRLTREMNGSIDASALVENVISLAKQHAQACGDPVRLIVFDHARLVMDGNPDDAANVTQLTRVLAQIAIQTSAAVFLLAHSPKTVLRQQAKEMSIADVAGSSAFSDNARSGFIMYAMREDDAKALQVPEAERKKYVKLECAKANYGPQGTAWWFEKVTLDDWQTAVLKPVSLIKPMFGPGQAKQQLRQRILDLLTSAPLSARAIRDRAGQRRPLGASEKEALAAVDALLEDGRIERRKPTPAEVQQFRLQKGREFLFVV